MTDDDPEPHTPPVRVHADDERTPPYQEQPVHLSPAEAKRIEQIIGRKPRITHHAMAERYRAEGADPLVMLAQIALDVHDMKKPLSWITKLAIGVASSSVAIIAFVAVAASSYTEKNTIVEYRLRACEADHTELQRLEALLRFPVASTPPTSSTKDPHP